MKTNELIRYAVPVEILDIWRQTESEDLLPLQEMAIKQYGLFGAENLLIQAPTSSGKTFVGEMAAVQAALSRKRAVYLVPLKALAEEKYREFRAKYEPYGFKVIVSTRDRREFDTQLEQGEFQIAVVVYEKLSQLLVRRPEQCGELGLVVADELELLSDPERGALVEILLTRLLQAGTRIIGLSAVIGRAGELAEWLRARLLYYERRPVELRYGVLHKGVFQYRTHNDRQNGEEELVNIVGQATWDVLAENVRMLAERGESCLVFVKAKHESRRAAEVLSRRLSLPAARDTIEALRDLESTRSRNGLLDTCANGVAFHNADLSPEERQAVEAGFRAGEIKVIVSTGTLAAGMNLPAQNVFISAEKWQYDDRINMPWKTPILRGEYENMGGRAGRYGAGHAFGRSILIALTPFDRESLWRRYVEGEREPIEPRLAKDSLENHILRLVAARFCRTDSELRQFLEGTLTANWVWRKTLSPDEIACRIRAAKNRAADAGAILSDPDRGRLEPTPFGLAVASTGILIETGRDLEHWILESQRRVWSDIDLLLAAAMTRDGRSLAMALTAQEYEHADYIGQLKHMTEMDDIAADVPMNRLRHGSPMPFFDEMRAVKTALVLADWIDHAAVADIEDRYRVMAGQILAAADQIAWLIDAAAAIATAMGASETFIERVAALSKRVQHGLRDEALPLAQLAFPGLNRSALIALASRGLDTPEALARVAPETLQGWLPAHTARLLKEWAIGASGGKSGQPAASREPVLVIDDRHPAEILLDGIHIRLQEKQYRLIRVLATAPGECIPYDTVYKKVWGDTIVNESQMSFQKRKLLSRIAEHLPDRSELVMTVPKRGFVLALPPEDVLLRTRAVPSMI